MKIIYYIIYLTIKSITFFHINFIIIDNTPPEASIVSPNEGAYVKAAVDVIGIADDPNLDRYSVDISEGQCDSAYKWASIKTATDPVRNGTLASWQALPSDGGYCLRIKAVDKLGSMTEAKVGVTVDTHPPAAPDLTGKVEGRTGARLEWTQSPDPDLAGYNIYRGGQKLNAELLVDASYLDRNLAEGTYAYTVRAVDRAGWESGPSNEVSMRIDLVGPNARISSPSDGATVGDLIDIKGTAYSADDFKEYRVSIGQGDAPTAWDLIRTSPVPVSYGSLAEWDTAGSPNGPYTVKLEAEDVSGNVTIRQVTVTVDNMLPQAPMLISAWEQSQGSEPRATRQTRRTTSAIAAASRKLVHSTRARPPRDATSASMAETQRIQAGLVGTASSSSSCPACRAWGAVGSGSTNATLPKARGANRPHRSSAMATPNRPTSLRKLRNAFPLFAPGASRLADVSTRPRR